MKATMGRLRSEDEEFLRERGDVMRRIGPVPDAVASDLGTAEQALLNAPWELGAEVLDWFVWNPVLGVSHPSPPAC
ncbi:hypothetical protein ACWDLL_26295 [Streptomyces griseoincarnatus]|uniref:hypothetical protein n=1 Tax=Streptomyces sp. SMS_SU21 TaxID=2069440 RepID=UPI000C880EE6|nr:hypothetical protein [Streptomyces sp. SMS_SU21]MCA2199562.1 hypothetical protein [Streptomyces sp. SMS_SU21]